MKKAIIYTTPTCGYCKLAKKFFDENNVEYVEHDVASDAEARQEMVDKSQQMGVPVIDIEGDVIVGFHEPKLRELLEVA